MWNLRMRIRLANYNLAIKEASMEGAWISFHKWTHNVNVDEILQDQESSMIFMAIFPGLRKEWRNVLPRIGALLGKVITTCDGQASGSDRVGGVPAVRVIAPRSVRLPTTISLPNLLTNKPPVMQNVYYQGLPNQCFVCDAQMLNLIHLLEHLLIMMAGLQFLQNMFSRRQIHWLTHCYYSKLTLITHCRKQKRMSIVRKWMLQRNNRWNRNF